MHVKLLFSVHGATDTNSFVGFSELWMQVLLSYLSNSQSTVLEKMHGYLVLCTACIIGVK